jgi:tRNA A-37 threonylcarbamoyl transferase component Bud32
MGTVVAATHLGLGRKVALKFMRLGVLDDEEAIGRFMREARAAATLRSEHVAQVMDVDVDSEDGAPYIVMEYLQGQDLGSLLKTKGVPPVSDAVGYVLQASEGLAEAHAHGIVHRDVKPANLFLTRRPDGTPLIKVLDFGVSKLNEAAHSSDSFRLTHPRKTIGSPQYMSPEQMVASMQVDSRADVWALGVILYELFTGKPPFSAPTFVELCLEVTNRPHQSLARRVPGLAPGLVAVVDRCLQKSPAARFPHVAALAAALVPHAGPGAEDSAARIARTLGFSGQTSGEPTAVLTWRSRGRRLFAIGLMGTGLAAAAVVAGGAIWRRQQPAPTEAAPPAVPSPLAPAEPARGSSPPPTAPAEPAGPISPPAAEPARAVSPPTERAPSSAPAIVRPAPLRDSARKSTSSSPARRRPRLDTTSDPIAPAIGTPPPPPPQQPAVDGATRTKRGPVVTDL